jgi:hypothetical protein
MVAGFASEPVMTVTDAVIWFTLQVVEELPQGLTEALE